MTDRTLVEIFKVVLYANKIQLDNKKQFDKKLESIFKKDNGRIQTNVNGFQSEDLLKSEFKSFVEILNTEVNILFKHYGGNHELKLDNFWLNVNGYKDYNINHIHPKSILSGVYYSKVPDNSGDIVFDHNAKDLMHSIWSNFEPNQYTNINSKTWRFTPEENLLLIFPSWLPHSVLPNMNKNEKRYSISFNFV